MAISIKSQPFQPRSTKNPVREATVKLWDEYRQPVCEDTGAPLIYPTDDLPDLLAFSHERPTSYIDIAELSKTQAGVAEILSSCDLEGLLMSLRNAMLDADNFALAYSPKHVFELEQACEAGADEFRTVYFIRGKEELNESVRNALQRLVDNHKKRIVVKKAMFSVVNTYGRYQRALQLVEKDVVGGWHFMLLADKHDIPWVVMDRMRFLPDHHLIIPKGVTFVEGFTPFKMEQVLEDQKRHDLMLRHAQQHVRKCKETGIETSFDPNLCLAAASEVKL